MPIDRKLREKLTEALSAVLPIVGIVMVLCFCIAPISSSILLCFLMGAFLVIVGIMFFSLGAELAMTPIGERVGVAMTKSRSSLFIALVSFALGFLVTVSEPDLNVLAGQIPAIENRVVIIGVALGTGIFLMLAVLRTLIGISLRGMLLILYIAVFALAFFAPGDFLAAAFDSGGVTTGPMTVPFIMAFGAGIASIRSDCRAAEDSFGLVAVSSVGPILVVLLLGMIYSPSGTMYEMTVIPEIGDSAELFRWFAGGLPEYMREMAVSLLPIVVFFALFQLAVLKIPRGSLLRIVAGLFYTYIGLTLFLCGANVGFMPAGSYLGERLATLSNSWILIPVAMLMGFFIVRAEPAVYVLNRQISEITDGAVSEKMIGSSLSIGVALSLGIAMLRVLTGIPVMYFLVPGYLAAFLMSFFVPRIYTAIAFDSGGVASGPMTATFLLPLAQGASNAIGGDIVADAFGVVAMVAMTPLITIQALGIVAKYTTAAGELLAENGLHASFTAFDDDAIIEF